MRKRLIAALVILILLAGLTYLLYPTTANQIAGAEDYRIIRNYRQTVKQMTGEQILHRLEDADEYNAGVTEPKIGDVFTGKETMTLHRYEAPLNTGDGVLGILTIPDIGVLLPVYHESAEHGAATELVHLQGTHLPSETAGTHMVLAGPGIVSAGGFAGEIGLTGAWMLEDLDRLTPGNLMILSVLDRTMVYQVEWVQTMSPEGLERLELVPEADEDLLTLVTVRKERRLLARGKRIAVTEAAGILKQTDRAQMMPDWESILMLGIPVIITGLIIMTVTERIIKRRYRLPSVTDAETENMKNTEKEEGKNEA